LANRRSARSPRNRGGSQIGREACIFPLTARLTDALSRRPHVLVNLIGESGSGKTTAARIARSLTDPSEVPTGTLPREARDLFADVDGSHLLCSWWSRKMLRQRDPDARVRRPHSPPAAPASQGTTAHPHRPARSQNRRPARNRSSRAGQGSLKATEQPIDTSTAGKCFLAVFAVETNLRRERQLEGIAKAKAAGVYKGASPPRMLSGCAI
jgi:hypothetical protein